MSLLPSATLHVSIDAPVERVYNYVSDPANLPEWAASFVQSVRREDNAWLADTTLGPCEFRFVTSNDLGVLDHYVRLPSAEETLNPLRVVANASGSEVLFTLFQPPDMSAQHFAENQAMVQRNLQTLKRVLEA